MRKLTKRAAVVAATAAVASTAGIAFAAWTSTGSGSGTATSAAISNVTFAGASTTSAVYPTGSSDIKLTIANPNNYNAALSAWSMTAVYSSTDPNLGNLGGGGTQPTDLTSTCDLSFTAPTGVVVAHNATVAPLTITNGLSMGNGAANSCASTTFVVKLTSTATSTASPATTS